jgi:hypothetical protein
MGSCAVEKYFGTFRYLIHKFSQNGACVFCTLCHGVYGFFFKFFLIFAPSLMTHEVKVWCTQFEQTVSQ